MDSLTVVRCVARGQALSRGGIAIRIDSELFIACNGDGQVN